MVRPASGPAPSARAAPRHSPQRILGFVTLGLGAAGAVEGAVCALAIQRGVVPPTIHYREPDPECPLDVVANSARQVDIACGVSTSLAFGGNNAALVMRRVA